MNVNDRVDAEIAEALAQFPMDPTGMRVEDLPAIRQMSRQMLATAPGSETIDHEDRLVPGDPEVLVQIYRPRGRVIPRGCIFWIHGGGYMIGSYDMDALELAHWCETFDCVAVSVEYRLAPENPYPAPLDDCYSALLWTFHNAKDLGIDPTVIGVGGASAGGGLAAGLCLLARDRGEVPLKFQLLIAPMIDDRQVTFSSQWEAPIWPPKANRMGWQAYLGDLYGGDVPAYAAASRAADLSGLPPTYILVGGVDGFVDEDVEYALRLNREGVPTEFHIYPGAPHGFDGLAPNASISIRANRYLDDWLGLKLGAGAGS